MAGHSAVGDLGRTLADHHFGSKVVLRALPRPGARSPQRPTSTQTGRQLPSQRAPALNVEGLVDRLVRDPHGQIMREVDAQSAAYLLRAPASAPAPIRSAAMAPSLPWHVRPTNRFVLNIHDRTGKPILYVGSQLLVRGKSRDLWALGSSFR